MIKIMSYSARLFILSSLLCIACQPADDGAEAADDTVGEYPNDWDCRWDTTNTLVGFTPARLIEHIHTAAVAWEGKCEGELTMSAWTVADLPCGIQCWATAGVPCDRSILGAAETTQCGTPEEVTDECLGQLKKECDRYKGVVTP
jgi:hypothetical protein